jgi:3-phenylpropionate/trans-cinnamate dioxygenase ferredoxin subunit
MTGENARWVEVLPLERLADQAIDCVRVGAADILLVRDGGRIMACERACPHEQADLSLGRIVKGRLLCPRHFGSFDLDDGHVSEMDLDFGTTCLVGRGCSV